MLKKRARIGIIGTGWWTTTAHIPCLLQNPDAELVALVDRRADAVVKAADAYGLSVAKYTDHRDMLQRESPDGVIVATNHSTHYEVARDCLDAGLHVMLEKPMVLYAQHARDLRDRAAAKGVELIVGYPWHYTANTRRTRDILQSGELGAIEYVSSLFKSMVIEYYRGDQEKYRPVFNFPVTGPGSAYADPALSGGGQGHLQITHSAGTLFFVTGLQAERVSAFMNPLDLRVDVADAISVRFRAQSGSPAVGIIGSTGNLGIGDGGMCELQVCCSRGRLTLEHIGGTLTVRHHDGREERYEIPESERYPMFATGNNLVDVVLGRGANESPAEVGVRTVELLDAAYRSAAADGAVVKIEDL